VFQELQGLLIFQEMQELKVLKEPKGQFKVLKGFKVLQVLHQIKDLKIIL
jgi:hypothetical protein